MMNSNWAGQVVTPDSGHVVWTPKEVDGGIIFINVREYGIRYTFAWPRKRFDDFDHWERTDGITPESAGAGVNYDLEPDPDHPPAAE